MRFSVRKRHGFCVFVLSALILVVMVIFLFWQIESNLKPTLMAIAQTKAKVAATQTINSVISKQVSSGIDAKSLVNITLDNNGRVVLLQPNTMEFNRLAADTTTKVQEALKELPNEKIYIPIGQLTGSKFFANMGPNFKVTVVPMGTVEVKIIDKFEQAGINQTRHMVHLAVKTQIRIVIPLVSDSVDVDTQVLIAEYIIVGEVPGTYVQVPLSLNN